MSRIPADYQLCLRVRDGDDWAFEELLRRHGKIVRAEAFTAWAPGYDRDDLLQVARIGLYRAAQTFRPDGGSSFANLARLAVRREVISAFIAAGRNKHQPLNDALSLSMRIAGEETPVTLGEAISGDERDDPAVRVIEDERFHSQVETILAAGPAERAAVAWRLNGRAYPKGQPGSKRIDNALQRVRRKLAAAA